MGNTTYEMIRKYAGQLAAMEHRKTMTIFVKSGQCNWVTKGDSNFESLSQEDIIKAEELLETEKQTETEEEAGREDRYLRAVAELFVSEPENSELQAAVLAVTPFCGRIARRGTPLTASLDDMAQIVGWQVRQAAPDAASIRRTLRNASACFLGEMVLATGRNLYEAVVALEVAEKSAEVTLRAEQLGGVRLLPRTEAHRMRRTYKKKYSKAEQEIKAREGKEEDEDGNHES